MQKILVFIDHYLPGYKSGGPVRTVANMVSRLSDRYQFFIFTLDRDAGDAEPYPGLQFEKWTEEGAAQVFYSSDNSFQNALRRVREVSPDLIYLNSFFSRFTIKVLLARKLGLFPETPLLLAPRGEFSAGALQIKSFRKKLYIAFVNTFGLLTNASLQGSTNYERKEIQAQLRSAKRCPDDAPIVACDLSDTHHPELLPRNPKRPGSLKLIFLSRISRKKNLDGALRMLMGVSGEITFSIYGPISDHVYWEECQELMKTLPANITAQYCGLVKPGHVAEVFSRNHLFFFPTLGENYGHVISEALIAGCPVLISDQTPWKNLKQLGVGADLPLEKPESFRTMLNGFIGLDDNAFSECSRKAHQYGVCSADDKAILEQNINLFPEVLRRSKLRKTSSRSATVSQSTSE